jgi:hypothetical protein
MSEPLRRYTPGILKGKWRGTYSACSVLSTEPMLLRTHRTLAENVAWISAAVARKVVSIAVRILSGSDPSFVDLANMRWSFIFYPGTSCSWLRTGCNTGSEVDQGNSFGYIVVRKHGTILQAKSRQNR